MWIRGYVYIQSTTFQSLLVQLIASRKLQRWMFKLFPFVTHRSNYKKEPEKASVWAASFFPSKVNTSYC